MLLHISSDGPPIYQQIVEQVRFRIVSGQLRSGDELPTIRGLAEDLRVNPNTVARAYRELEHESLVEKRRTTGTFVAELPKRLGIAQRRKLIAAGNRQTSDLGPPARNSTRRVDRAARET